MRNRRGVLLLEVMMSIVVLTSGLLFVTRVYSTSKEAIKRSGELFKESLLLEERIFEFEEKGDIERASKGGEFADYKGYFWELSASALEGADELNAIALDVYRTKGYKYSLRTYLRNKPSSP